MPTPAGDTPAPHPFAPIPSADDRPPLTGLALRPLQARYGARPVLGTYALVGGLVSIALMTGAALLTGQPLIFPSLGPTAYLVFSDPMGPAAAPRNAVLGHLIGVLAGYGSLLAFGLAGGGADAMSADPGRIGAAAVSLAITSAAMVWLGLPHPPAAATTLIVSLGILAEPPELAVLMLAVVVLVAVGWVINRLSGVPVPAWAPRREPVEVRPAGLGGPGG